MGIEIGIDKTPDILAIRRCIRIQIRSKTPDRHLVHAGQYTGEDSDVVLIDVSIAVNIALQLRHDGRRGAEDAKARDACIEITIGADRNRLAR